MTQHLRIGSVVDIFTTTSGTVAEDNAVVTNITPAYIEVEVGSPAIARVRPWSFISRIDVVSD